MSETMEETLDRTEREFLQAKRTLAFHERRDHRLSIDQYQAMRQRIIETQAAFEAALDDYRDWRIIEREARA